MIQTVTVGAEPTQIAINAATNKAYVSLHGAGRIAVISGTVAVCVANPDGTCRQVLTH